MTLYKFRVHGFIKWHLYTLLYASHLTSTLLPSPRPPYPLILFYLNLNSHKWPVTSILNHTGEKSFHFQESRTRKINSNYRWENWNSEICSNWIGLNTLGSQTISITWLLQKFDLWPQGQSGEMFLIEPHSGTTINSTRHFVTIPSSMLGRKRN